jgi:hypothetical protein
LNPDTEESIFHHNQGHKLWCLDFHWLLDKMERKFDSEFKAVLKEDARMKGEVFFNSIFDASPHWTFKPPRI